VPVSDGAAPESALLVPVPEAEPCVRRHRFRYDSVALRGVPAHITVLYPFVPPRAITDATLASVREVLARFPPFSFRLARLERFPEGALYLAPDPAKPFVQLTEAFGDQFPDYPPYGGIHAEVIPHLTVAQDHDAPADEFADISDNLPIACHAREIWLMSEDQDHQWRAQSTFRLVDGARA
jgi:2'-5' RNA ligase